MEICENIRNNIELCKQLMQRCTGLRVVKLDEYGIPNQARESLAFALLAWWHILQKEGNSPSITGALKPAVLGTMVHPPTKSSNPRKFSNCFRRFVEF